MGRLGLAGLELEGVVFWASWTQPFHPQPGCGWTYAPTTHHCTGYPLFLHAPLAKVPTPAGRTPTPTPSSLLTGIISCMAFPPDGAMLAAGTYAGCVGVFDPRSPPAASLQLLMHGHRGGLTQVGMKRLEAAAHVRSAFVGQGSFVSRPLRCNC